MGEWLSEWVGDSMDGQLVARLDGCPVDAKTRMEGFGQDEPTRAGPLRGWWRWRATLLSSGSGPSSRGRAPRRRRGRGRTPRHPVPEMGQLSHFVRQSLDLCNAWSISSGSVRSGAGYARGGAEKVSEPDVITLSGFAGLTNESVARLSIQLALVQTVEAARAKMTRAQGNRCTC